MSETEIIVSVIDQASTVFGDISSSAESSFGEITEAGDSASSSMDGIETASTSVNTAIDSIDPSSLNDTSTAADDADVH